MTENDNEPDNCCCCPDDNCGDTCHSGCCYSECNGEEDPRDE